MITLVVTQVFVALSAWLILISEELLPILIVGNPITEESLDYSQDIALLPRTASSFKDHHNFLVHT